MVLITRIVMTDRQIISAILVLTMLCACTKSISPPVRNSSFGIPAHVEGGDLDFGIAATYSYLIPGPGATPEIAFGITDLVAIEGGGTFTGYPIGYMGGWAGARITPLNRERINSKFMLDIGIGAGAGAGGALCLDFEGSANCPKSKNPDANDSFFTEYYMYGFYLDAGFGWQFKEWVGFYIRPGIQITKANDTDTSYWVSLAIGPQFTIGAFEVYLALGPMFAFNNGISLVIHGNLGIHLNYNLY